MSLLSDIRRKFLGSRAFQAILWGQGTADYTKWDKRKLVEQGYERNPAFAAICDRISELVASLPVYVEYTNEKGGAEQSTTHPLLDALDRSDNGYRALIRRTSLYLEVTGEAYLQKLVWGDEASKRIVGFVCLPAQYTNPIQGKDLSPIEGYELVWNGRQVFTTSDVIYINAAPSLSSYLHGSPFGLAVAELMDMQNSAITWNKNVAKGGGTPQLVIKAPGITPEDSEKMKSDWVRVNGGASNAHKPVVIDGGEGMSIQNLAFKPNEAEWAKGIEMATRIIAMRRGFPSELLNDPSGKTYANVSEATKSLYRDVVIPAGERIFEAINRDCSRYYRDRPRIRIDKDRIEAMGEDRRLAVERLSRAVREGILTPNEAREELGYSPSDDESAGLLSPKKDSPAQSVGFSEQP